MERLGKPAQEPDAHPHRRRCRGEHPVHPSANVIATAATLNVVRTAAGRHSAVRISTPMIRDGKCGRAGGRARKIANAWASSSTTIPTFRI
jgi:hypothetical protein